jgi:hypothetical protein
VEICTTDRSTRATTCSYCCSKEETAAVEAAAGDELAAAAPGPLPPALLQAAAAKTIRTAPALLSSRPAAALRGSAWAARPVRVPPGPGLPIGLLRIPGLLYTHGTTTTRRIQPTAIPPGP